MNKTIIEKLRMAQVSSCSCLTKTPEPSWHDESCSYRVLSEAVTAIAQVTALQDRITSLHHVGMELTGVIDEYRAMPCFSLQQRMFSTADRYRLRLTAKCQTCKDTGVTLIPGATLDDNWVRAPCPDCVQEELE